MFRHGHSGADELTEETNALKDFIAKRDACERFPFEGMKCGIILTDEDALVETLCARTKSQLERVDQAYREKYQKSLWSELKNDIHGNYERMLKYAIMPRDEYISHIMYEACSGFGTDESLLIEVLTPVSNEEIEAAKACYEAKHDQSLIDRIKKEMSGGLEKLIIRLLRGERDESKEADMGLAEDQVAKLHDAGVGKFIGTDDDVFIDIIGKSSRAQIQAVKDLYEETHGMSLRKAVGKEFRGDLRVALQGMLETPVDYHCILIRKAAKGIGTDEKAICRVLGSHDKHQIEDICTRFAEKYDKTLAEVVADELSGDFRLAVEKWIDPLADPTLGLEQRLEDHMRHSGDRGERMELLKEENENLRNFIFKTDAREIRRACKGIGTEENRVIDVLCNRSKDQVEKIDQVYRERYDMTLRRQLEKDLGGNLKKFMIFTQMETDEFDAIQMKDAMAGLGTDEDVLINILTTRSNAAIEAAQKYYEDRYDESLVDKINEEMSGKLQTIVLNLLKAERDESPEGDMDAADTQADTLHDSWDKDIFVEILTKTSHAQAALIRQVYEDKHGKSLVKTIMRKFSGDVEDALLALLFDPIENYARALKKAFHGLGTDEDMVCRVLGGNDKETCIKIAERYEEKYDTPLVTALKDDLGGKFKRAAIEWVSPIELVFEADWDERYGEQTEDDPYGHGGGHCYGEEEPEDIDEQLATKYDEDRKEDKFGFGFGWFGRGVDDEEDEDEETIEARYASRDEAKEAEIRRMKARLNKSRMVAMERNQRRDQYSERMTFTTQARTAASNAREQVQAAKEKYGNEVIPGLKVCGKWDPDLYQKHNDDVEDDPWEHYISGGFDEGRLIRIDNDCGAFVGIPDFVEVARTNEVDVSEKLEEAPYEPQLVGLKVFTEEGKDAEQEIIITQVVPIYLTGVFNAALYAGSYPDVTNLTSVPRPGRFDDEGYRALHPEVNEEGISPFEHFKQNRRALICVRGRAGFPNRRWYMETYGKKSFSHYFRKGYEEGLHLLLLQEEMTPMGHFCKKGHAEGRRVTFRTAVGQFEGVLDEEKFLEINPDAAESGVPPLEYLETQASDAKLAVVQIRMLRVYTSLLPSDRRCQDVEDSEVRDFDEFDEEDGYDIFEQGDEDDEDYDEDD